MKKSSLIFLTLVASFSVTVSVAQTDSLNQRNLTDFIYEPDKLNTVPARVDTNRVDSVRYDTVVVVPQPIFYNYYYRSRFWDGLYRFWAPGRYYRTINRTGFVPAHIRPAHVPGHGSFAHGGFGRTGNGRGQTN